MARNKEELWDEYQVAVPKIKDFPDLAICTFYWLILEKWQNLEIEKKAYALLSQYRPRVAEDVRNNGPMTFCIKATWNNRRGCEL